MSQYLIIGIVMLAFMIFYCRAVFYKEDMKIEMKNYNRFLPVYGLNDSDTGPMKEFEDNDGCTYTLDQLGSLTSSPMTQIKSSSWMMMILKKSRRCSRRDQYPGMDGLNE